jgi:hypothetical protein
VTQTIYRSCRGLECPKQPSPSRRRSRPGSAKTSWPSGWARAGAQKARLVEIWERFPKFILGFVATFLVALALGTTAGSSGKLAAAIGEANVLRVILFVLTFFSSGVMSNFRQEGFGKLAAVYLVSRFGFVIWVGFVISWLFFAGIKPPLAS